MTESWLVVHGRFQPFHLGHFEYVNIAALQSPRVVIGITNPNIHNIKLESTSGHRHLASTNPFTYFERAEMVARSTAGLNVTIRIVPFDISEPDSWADYLPARYEHLVTVNEEWDAEKARRFVEAGIPVHRVEGNPSRVTATDVRRRITDGSPSWRSLVPAGTAEVIDEFGLATRLRPVMGNR